MKTIIKFFTVVSLLSAIVGSNIAASAESVDTDMLSQDIAVEIKETGDIAIQSEVADPLSNTDAYLDTEYWTILKSSTTVFPYSPVITNQSYNRGVIWVKVEDKDGNLIGSPKLVSPGDSATMDMISAFTGYTISAKAYTLPGSYMITID